MPVGNITGLSSGIDWGNTVDMMMQLERRPAAALMQRRTEAQSKLTNWGAIESKLTTLQTTAEGLDTLDEFLSKIASSTDTDTLTVSAGAAATPASHNIIINQLATNATHSHEAGWADLTATPVNSSGGNQTFAYDYAGTTVSVTVPDGATLQGLINLINQDTDNPGVVAFAIDDGSGGAAPFHLMLSGADTGSGNDITIDDGLTDLDDGVSFDSANWAATQSAQNSEIRVDGFPDPAWGWPNPWIESDSNDVEDVIPGVTLHLQDDSGGGTIAFEISLDVATIKSKVKSLVDAYNDVITTINNLSSYDAENEVAAGLFGDSFAIDIKQTLSAFFASNIPGSDTGDVYRSLGQAGISIGAGGKLTIDNTELEEALEDDATGVARMFVFDSESSSSYVSVTGHDENTAGGVYSFELTYDASGNINEAGTNTINGVNATVYGDSLVGGAADDDTEGLLMLLTNPGDGPNSLTGTVQVYTGISVLLYNEIEFLSDSYDGRLKTNREGINANIDNLDDRLAAWERRLDQIEEAYNRKFSQMEILIGQLQTQGAFLSGI